MAVRHLYLSRHGEPGGDGQLTERGVRQAELLGDRLADVPLTSFRHGSLPRAVRTAHAVASRLHAPVTVTEHAVAGDYVPHLPGPDEIDADVRDGAMAFLAGVTPEEARAGAALASEAVQLLAGPEPGETDGHHLVVTHAFTIGWLVRHALDAPPWRWVGLDSNHAALTVLRYAPGRPPALVTFNDTAHLTGL